MRDRPTRLAASAAMLGLALSVACATDEPAPGPRPPRPVVSAELATASLDPIPVRVRATGTAEPRRRVAPGTKLMGRIAAVPVRAGEKVSAGQLLAEIESRDLVAAVTQAQAAVSMARATLENAETHFRRMTDLHRRGSVTDKALEDSTAAWRVAGAALEQAEANLEASRATLSYARVVAPIAGWITSRAVEAGDMTTPGLPMFTLEDLSEIEVVIRVPETDIVGLVVGDEAEIRVDVLDAQRSATIERIVPSGDPGSRTFEVRLLIDNADASIKSGMFVRALFPRDSRDGVLVPGSALVRRGQLNGLFVVAEDGVARLRWVRLGRPLDDAVEVISGLHAGERYVVAPGPELRDGAQVQSR